MNIFRQINLLTPMRNKSGCASVMSLLLGLIVLLTGCAKSNNGYLFKLEQYSASLDAFRQQCVENGGHISLDKYLKISQSRDELDRWGKELAEQHLPLSDSEKNRFKEIGARVSSILADFSDEKFRNGLLPTYPWPSPANSPTPEEKPVAMNKLLVNVAGTMGARFLLVSLTLDGSGPEFRSKVTAHKDQLRDVAQSILSSKTLADLEKPGCRDVIRSELIAGFNKALGLAMVQNIYITEFVIQ